MGSSQSTTHPIPEETYTCNSYMKNRHRTEETSASQSTQYSAHRWDVGTTPSTVQQTRMSQSRQHVETTPSTVQQTRMSQSRRHVETTPSTVQQTCMSQSRRHVETTPSTVQQTCMSQSRQDVIDRQMIVRSWLQKEFHEKRDDKPVDCNIWESKPKTLPINKETSTMSIVDKNNIKVNLSQITKPPDTIKSLKDFLQKWSVWKVQFIAFMTVMDEEHKNDQIWGNYLLNFMGPVAQEIRSLLYLNKEDDNKNYVILMAKFNLFYELNMAAKLMNESPIEYIERLKDKAAGNIKNLDEILKNKLAKDIKKLHKERFIALASSKLPYFRFETKFQSLTLREIAFLWEICEKSAILNNKSCICCGSFHENEECPAWGTKCDKCNRENHFMNFCPGPKYIYNCSYCGGDHKRKQCLAYGETCSKCGKENHFSWKCGNKILISNCHFCGLSHINDRKKCPAKNSLCGICKVRGHYDINCNNTYKKNL